ncbi:mfs nicotinic acid transporter tna1 [Lichtheimia corymbifera JMRC:FSU:9682]|uniref:Mfs nicotinic acid transporter tna1 n=1 Tax=Lichtheimia corymbifera JMRC:FSU:9682 TaxID=1263082 RepID=A0A068RKM5_9FUNG|nr:mfs nicotinic acid transporter tna1 [Lichtheimia corymbifera JMRC:FSU:9682]
MMTPSTSHDNKEKIPVEIETKSNPDNALVEKRLLRYKRMTRALSRSNIGNAKLGGLQRDLGLSHFEYQWTLSIFFFGYIFMQVPSNIVMRRWRPSTWLGVLMGAWGIIATCMAACHDFAGIVVCRLLLGACEAVLSIWYMRKEYARRAGLFFSFSSLAGAFGGLLAYALFILEGIPSVILAAFSAWYLPDKAESATFLTMEERTLQKERLERDAGASQDQVPFSWAAAFSVFRDWKLYAYMVIYLLGTCALQGVTLFLPSIVMNTGTWSHAQSQALTTPPYVLSFLGTLLVSYSSDRFFDRAYHMMACNLIGIIGFLVLILLPPDQVAGQYTGACLVVIGVYCNVPPKVSWFSNNFGGDTRRAIASAVIVSFGMAGGALGGQIYYDPPNYTHGNTIALACLAAQTVIVFMLRTMLARENRRRNEIANNAHARDLELLRYGGPAMAGDRHPDYRYVL